MANDIGQIAVAILAAVGGFYVLHILGFGTIYKVYVRWYQVQFGISWSAKFFRLCVTSLDTSSQPLQE